MTASVLMVVIFTRCLVDAFSGLSRSLDYLILDSGNCRGSSLYSRCLVILTACLFTVYVNWCTKGNGHCRGLFPSQNPMRQVISCPFTDDQLREAAVIWIQVCLISEPIFEDVGNSQPFQAKGFPFHCQISQTSHMMADVLCFLLLFIIVLKYFTFVEQS